MERGKWIRGLGIALTIGTLLAGCGNSDSAAGPQEEVSSEKENFNETGFPIVNEKISVSMMGSKAAIQGAWDTLKFFVEMENKTNISFTFDTPASEVFEEKKNLALAGGNYPDVFFGAGLTNAQQIKYGMDEKILIPLDDLIENYGPNIKKMFEEHPEVKQSITAPDGHIYALPNFNEGSLAKTPTWWYNGEWLEELGISADELPTTTEEFYELLKRFKTEDPNGNGETDEIPFTFITNSNLDYLDPNLYILPAFGVNSPRIYVEGGTVKYGALEANYKEYLKYMNRLFSEELIDPEWATQDDSARIGKAKANTVGIAAQALPQNLYDVTDAEEAKAYPMAPALSSEFTDGEQRYLLYSQGITPGAFAITEKCEYPEAMIRWADYLYGEEGSFFIHYGEEGELWKFAEDGRYEYITPDNGMTVEEYRGGIITPDCGTTTPKWVRPSTVSDWVDPFQGVRIGQVDTLAIPYGEVAFPSTFFLPDQQNRIDVIEADLNKYMEEMEAAFFTGTKDIESEYEEFIATLKKMNVEELIEIYQESYDSWADAQ